jgi:hypothetical protein
MDSKMWFLIGRPLGSVRSPARNGVATSIAEGWLISAEVRVATMLLLFELLRCSGAPGNHLKTEKGKPHLQRKKRAKPVSSGYEKKRRCEVLASQRQAVQSNTTF